MVLDLTPKELSHLRRVILYRIESLRQFTGRSIEADIEQLILIREKLQVVI